MTKRKRKHGKYKLFIEIRTSKNQWKRVELIKNKGSIIIIKLPSGEIVGRKNKQVRPVTRRISSKASYEQNSYTKKFRTKKKRKQRMKKVGNKHPNISNKWKDPKKLTLENVYGKRK